MEEVLWNSSLASRVCVCVKKGRKKERKTINDITLPRACLERTETEKVGFSYRILAFRSTCFATDRYKWRFPFSPSIHFAIRPFE